MATYKTYADQFIPIKTGGSLPTIDEYTAFMTEGLQQIINAVPTDMLWMFETSEADIADDGVAIGTNKIMYVQRESDSNLVDSNSDGSNNAKMLVECREVPASLRGRVTPGSGYQEEASETDPVWYKLGGKVFMFPSSTSVNSKIFWIQNPPTGLSGSNEDYLAGTSGIPIEVDPLVMSWIIHKGMRKMITEILVEFRDKEKALHETTTAIDAAFIQIPLQLTSASSEAGEIGDALADAETTLGKAETEIANALAVASELSEMTGVSSEFAVALEAANDSVDQVNGNINSASFEYIKVQANPGGSANTSSPIYLASAEFDIAKELIGKDGLTSVIDLMGSNLDLAEDNIELAKVEANEVALQTDNVGDYGTALKTMNKELDKATAEITKAGVEFDKCDGILDMGEEDSEGKISTALDSLTSSLSNVSGIQTNITNALSSSSAKLGGAEDVYISSAHDKIITAMDKVAGIISTADTSFDLAVAANEDDDSELAMSNVQTGQGFVAEAGAYVQEAQGYIGEVQSRTGVIQIEAALSQGYVALVGGYLQEIAAKIQLAQGFGAEVQARLTQAQTKREECKSRVGIGTAYLTKAQGYVTEANGYAAEVNARSSFTGAKLQAIQGFIFTTESHIKLVQGLASQVQSYAISTKLFLDNGEAYLKEAASVIGIGNAKLAEAQARLAESKGYIDEVTGRSQFASIKDVALKGHITTAGTYLSKADKQMAIAQNYGTSFQSYTALAQGYAAEIASRLTFIDSELKEYTLNTQARSTLLQGLHEASSKHENEFKEGLMLLSKGSYQAQTKDDAKDTPTYSGMAD